MAADAAALVPAVWFPAGENEGSFALRLSGLPGWDLSDGRDWADRDFFLVMGGSATDDSC
jgi:hypothetical protein